MCDPINVGYDPIKSEFDLRTMAVYNQILENNSLTYAGYASRLEVSEVTIKRHLGILRDKGVIRRMGSNKKGYWEILRRI